MNIRMLYDVSRSLTNFGKKSVFYVKNFHSPCVWTREIVNARNIYYAATPVTDPTSKKLLDFLKKNEKELKYVPPRILTKSEEIERAKIEIQNLAPDQANKLKVLQWELDLLRETNSEKVPRTLTDLDWMNLLSKTSTNQRSKYLKYVLEAQNRDMKDKELKEEKAEVPRTTNPTTKLYLWLLPSTMKVGINDGICESLMKGPYCVMDMGFEDVLTEREKKNTMNQISVLHGINKTLKEPFHISFTDLKRDEYFQKYLAHTMPADAYVKTESSFMDMFPADKLIYLSPDAPREMKKYDPDAVYVIGGLVDKTNTDKCTFAKAKKLKITTERFPIDRYLDWQIGSKRLTLDQVFAILATMKDVGDWNAAFQHIPRRKLKVQEDTHQRFQKKRSNLNKQFY